MTAIWDGKTSKETDSDFDCYIAEVLLSEGRHIGTLSETLQKYQVKTLPELAENQKKKLEQHPKLSSLYFDVELPLSTILSRMEARGILLDTKALTKVGILLDEKISSSQKALSKEIDGSININSSTQLGVFLVEKVGVPLGKTRTGKYATNFGELTKFAEQYPIIKELLRYRELSKLRSTYVDSLIEKADKNGRVHTTYHQMFVNTGRLASSNPNLQNIPVSSEEGLAIKSCFIATPGYILVSFDYSQQELRILAHLANETSLIKAFEQNQDVHTLTASKLFGVAYTDVTKQQRNVGKTINFGIIYGMSSFGMSAGLHIPQTDAEQFIQQFYASYPNIKIYYDEYLKNARIHNVCETILGRRRYVFENTKQKFIDNGTRRVLMNYPIQGSAADLMKKAMVDVDKKILKQNSDVHLLLQIHDDLVFEIPEKDTKKFSEIVEMIKNVLCSVYPLKVPLLVESKQGKKWGEMKKIN